ncbi:MAG TPA: GNAT family N-acetyltransferase [Candidatus Baltobacteraceae bacterium]|nr:GNAT family N-acetyltransferase [Candidatus Baltobacteraceae bacterium]
MAAKFRRATAADAPLLGEHRARLWSEATQVRHDVLRAQVTAWSAWFADAIADGTYVAWIGEDDGATVASGGLLLLPAIPRPGGTAAREGRVHSVFVVEEARRRGIARALMHVLLDHARDAGLQRLKLHPSEVSRALYASLGFAPIDEMGLDLIGRDPHR